MRKLLIANRGEIARRIQQTCRELGIATVAVYAEPDRDAPFVREADEAVPLGGAAPAESYLRIDKLIDAAKRTGADAVHPGYGFLSERAEFASACRDAGLRFVGPPPEAIAAMGSKLEAKRRMQQAGVPSAPEPRGRGRHEAGGARRARRRARPAAPREGVGGRRRQGHAHRARRGRARRTRWRRRGREALAAFGDGTVYLERYLEGARHVEVQIFGDSHGNVIHLHERECSIQRRHQKIVEESPSPAVSPQLRAAICGAAVAAGRAIRLRERGHGRVPARRERRVLLPRGEHAPPGRAPGDRVGDRPRSRAPADRGRRAAPRCRAQEEVPPPHGHAIEVRLYAEDAERDYAPSTGTLHRFAIPIGPGLRLDSGVEDGSEVTVHYDPMLAKVIAWAPVRSEAAAILARALAQAKIHGPRTNRDLLVGILRHPEYLAGRTDTHFLERHRPAELGAPLCGESGERVHALAAALALQAERRADAAVLGSLPSGWRNVPSQDELQELEGRAGRIAVAYRVGRDGVRASIGGEPAEGVRVHACSAAEVDLEVAGVRRRVAVHRVGERVFVDSALGASDLRAIPRFAEPEVELAAGSLVAPMPGVVRQVCVAVGDAVAKGDVLLVLEAMKMETPIRAPGAGTVTELRAGAGDQVEAGALLAVIEEQA